MAYIKPVYGFACCFGL